MTKKEFKKIRGALLMQDVTFQDIAKEFHTSKQAVSLAVHMRRDSDSAKKIRAHIEKLIGRVEGWHI